MGFPPGLRPVEAFWFESLPHVLTVLDSGDNSLCFPASGSDSPAGCLAPLDQTICFRTQFTTTLLALVFIFMTRCDRHGHGRLSCYLAGPPSKMSVQATADGGSM